MVPLDRALVSSYRLSIVTMSLSAAVRQQFTTQVFRGGNKVYVTSEVMKISAFTFRAQATKCSKHRNRTAMDAGCKCVPGKSANL